MRDTAARNAFPVDRFRSQFPALARAEPFIYFDNAAGAQAPRLVLDRVASHLLDFNVQRGGRYAKSVEVDRSVAEARERVLQFTRRVARLRDEVAHPDVEEPEKYEELLGAERPLPVLDLAEPVL